MQYPNGHLAHGYVLEEFRGKGLLAIFAREIGNQIIGDGVLPETSTSPDNPVQKLALRMGMIELCRQKTLKLAHANSYATN